MPLLQKINELTPLKDWKLYDSKRDDSGNEDY
jgi:hypothetical protein